MRVAMRPEATCHSMWQWKSQMRGEGELAGLLGVEGLGGMEGGGTYQDCRL